MTLSVRYDEARQPAIDRNLHSVLDEHPNATGLIVHNDASVAALPHVLHHRGVRVPDDLSVVSLYAKDFARWFSLPYTAVASPRRPRTTRGRAGREPYPVADRRRTPRDPLRHR